jgi:hypothetical protein
MSIPVKLDSLDEALADYGYAYLMTVGETQRTHVVAVTPALQDGVLRVEQPGRRTASNAETRPGASLVFPPAEPGGYSLIVDGDARRDGDQLLVTPTSAVLHRPAEPGAGPSASGCGSDCHHVTVEA